MNQNSKRFAMLAMAIATLLISSSAKALPYSVQASATVDTSGPIPQHAAENTGLVPGLGTHAGPLALEDFNLDFGWDFGGNANIVAQIGTFNGTVQAFGSSTSASGGASASASASWADTITITSDTLSPGTPVSFLATLTLHRTVFANSGIHSTATASAKATGPFGLSLLDSSVSPNPTVSISTVVNTTVGAVLNATSTLELATSMSGDFSPFGAGASASVGDNSGFTFMPITPGASFSTASGATFATVPEPSAVALAGIATIALLATRLRRRF